MKPLAALFSAAALMSAAMAVASAVATVVAADALGAAWGGLPPTGGIVGAGLGSLALTRIGERRGRRRALAVGYLAAVAGGALAVFAAGRADVAGLTLALVLLGIGNAAAQLSRYAAADLYPAHRRGAAIGVLVWAGALGAIGGPLLLGLSDAAGDRLGAPPLTGPFVLAAAAAALAAAVVGRVAESTTDREAPVERTRLRELLAAPVVRPPLAVMATGQVIMVIVMTAVPVEMHRHGDALGTVGVVLAAHTLGMFGLSPLTGRLLDRFGAGPVMVAGPVVLVAATTLAAAVGAAGRLTHPLAVVLIGYGWNLCFVGGSGRLAAALPPAERARTEGAVDAVVWGAASIAGLGSTMLLAAGGYRVLAVAAGALVLVPAFALAPVTARRAAGGPSGPVPPVGGRSGRRASGGRSTVGR